MILQDMSPISHSSHHIMPTTAIRVASRQHTNIVPRGDWQHYAHTGKTTSLKGIFSSCLSHTTVLGFSFFRPRSHKFIAGFMRRLVGDCWKYKIKSFTADCILLSIDEAGCVYCTRWDGVREPCRVPEAPLPHAVYVQGQVGSFALLCDLQRSRFQDTERLKIHPRPSHIQGTKPSTHRHR